MNWHKRIGGGGICLVLLASAALLFAQPATAPSTPATESGEKTVTPSGLTIIKLAPGSGAQAGDTVHVHYTGTFPDGKKFDSSYDHPGKEPISFRLGSGGVIKGWEEGITGMQVGEKRHLIIPPDLAYGAKGRGQIPPNATLEFDLQLVGIQRE
jgi:peptidylprolyl isomerase